MIAEDKPACIRIGQFAAELDCAAAMLRMADSAGKTCLEFKLLPFVEYIGAQGACGGVTARQEAGGHYVLTASDGLTDMEAHVQVKNGWIDYWLCARPADAASPAPEILCVHYGQDGPTIADASTHALEEFFIVCPDRYGSLIPRKDKMCFKLGVPSFRFGKDNAFPHEGGRTIISPYVAALRSGQSDWLGIGTLEIPTSEYGLNMTFQESKAVIDFFYGGNLRLAGEGFTFPKITFFAGDEKVATVRKYVDRLYAEGMARPNTQWEQSWGGPIYCFFADQMYEYQTDREGPELQGEMTMTENYCNDAFLQKCLDALVEKAIPYGIIIIDYGWFITNGHWRPNTRRFADFKATIKKLQGMGKKVLVWYSPYFVAEQSPHYQSHPEIAVKKRDGKPFYVVRFGSEVNYQSDFTHPSMRELCRQDIEFMLSPQGLDADGIKVDCTHQPPTIDNVFHDPSWGTGEMFHYKASKLMYDLAKSIKPDCCMNATAGNPLFNGTYDLHRIHDALEYNLEGYEERAWAAWLCGAGVSDLDDWPSYDIYTVRANVRKIAYGVPSLYAVRKRGGQRKVKSAWGYSVSVSDEESQLLESIYEVYLKAPADLSQRIHIDPFDKTFWRKYTSGPLSGFYAATTLCGNQAAAVYSPAQGKAPALAHAVSISDVPLALPLPSATRTCRIQAIARDGRAVADVPGEVVDNELIFNARRCVGDLKYYRIELT